MIRLLATHRDVDATSLHTQFPTLIGVNEVDVAPEAVDDNSPEGRWLAGYWNDDEAPNVADWEKAVAAAPPPAPPTEPTVAEKLAALGLTVDDIKALLTAPTKG